MRYIANILTDGKFDNTDLYNVVKTESELIDGIPTLIIGWEKTHELYPEANIIEWKISENLYWTFGKREKRDVMEDRVAKFKKIALNMLVKKVKYTFLNILTLNTEVKKRFYASLKNSETKILYIINDMMYFYYKGTDNVIGISLRDIDYSGGDRKKIFATVYSCPHIEVVKNEINFSFETRNILRNNLYIIPYLCSQ